MNNKQHPDYDPGLLSDFGGGDVSWWQDYLRSEIERANDYWQNKVDAFDGMIKLASIHEKAKSALQTSWLYSGKNRVEMLMREIEKISLHNQK